MTSETSPTEVVYEVVDVADVPLDVWLVAQRTLRWCEGDLGLSDLRIEWLRTVPAIRATSTVSMANLLTTLARMAGESFPEPQAFRSRPIAGQVGWFFNDGCLRVRCDQSLEEVVRTVAHEAKHVADSRIYRPPRLPAEWQVAEDRARAYEERVWAQLADTLQVKTR